MPEQGQNLSRAEVLAYTQGVALSNISFLAEQVAPTTPVGAPTGKFKKYDLENAFLEDIQTRRSSGGDGLFIEFDGSDPTYNCEPHAVNVPVDMGGVSDADRSAMVLQAADMAAFVGGISHERSVLKKARAAVNATAKNWGGANTPIKDIDAALRLILLATYGGYGMEFHIAFGMGAWEIFKNNASVAGKFIVNSGPSSGVAYAIPTIDTIGTMFLTGTKSHLSIAVQNEAAKGKAADKKFLMDNEIMLWARAMNPNQLDQGFMKTFRLRNAYMRPHTWESPSKRVSFEAFDWSEDVQIVNAAAAVRHTINS